MIKNYFKIAWRNLWKNKAFSLINILGLTIGITVCMMIFLFIVNEFSVDKFHKHGNNIYRVMRSFDGSKDPAPYLSAPYATALLNDFPDEIKKAVRVIPTNSLISFDNTSFNEKKVYIADSDFFQMFSFPLLIGDAATVLKEPGSIVLTETTAKKFFGSINKAMGKIVEMDKQNQLKVTGIAKDVPSNSHMDFDLVVPISNYFHDDWFHTWIDNDGFTYVLLSEHADKNQLEKQFRPFVEKYMGEDMKRMNAHFTLLLTPLKDIYFEHASSFDDVKHGDKTVVYIFLSIAVLILGIGGINFMYLSTIRSV
jgi:putative ABC transport system permease protein